MLRDTALQNIIIVITVSLITKTKKVYLNRKYFLETCAQYYKCGTILIYAHNYSGLYYKCVTIVNYSLA